MHCLSEGLIGGYTVWPSSLFPPKFLGGIESKSMPLELSPNSVETLLAFFEQWMQVGIAV